MAIDRWIKASMHHCEVLAVVTHQESVSLCKEFGFNCIQAPNNPVGAKFNRGMQYAIENIEFEYCIILGDDDIMCDSAWGYYSTAMRIGSDHVGFGNLYMWAPKDKIALKYEYGTKYSKRKLVGCGRMLSYEALVGAGVKQSIQIQKTFPGSLGLVYRKTKTYSLPIVQAEYFIQMGWATPVALPGYELWSNTQDTGLDNECELSLLSCRYYPHRIITPNPVMVDIKTEKNIWPIKRYQKISIAVKEDDAKSLLSAKEIDYIQSFLT